MRTTVRERAAEFRKAGREKPRHSSVTEWARTILIYLFATTTLVQAYVIPSGSMEGSLLVGDHVLVDRSAYADAGALGGTLCLIVTFSTATSSCSRIRRTHA